MKKFKIKQYTISQLSERGAWLVETKEGFDLTMLFIRVQEFYESSNPAFQGHAFTMMEYMRWYSMNMSEHNSFTYADDWKGFNLPYDVIDKFFRTDTLEQENEYDLLFKQIAKRVWAAQGGEYYLLGTKTGDSATIDHELSHAMWRLKDGYKDTALQLLAKLPQKDLTAMRKTLSTKGYAKSVIDDELMAYLGTGLTESMEQYDAHRVPFMQHFYSSKLEFLGER